MIIFIRSRKIFLLLSLFYFSEGLGQSAWDIGYIGIDSISKKDTGREVRLDFKNKQQMDIGRSARFYLSGKDTGILVINDVRMEMIEIRQIYADWGLYKEQWLESLHEIRPGIKLRLANSVIKEVKPDSLLILANIEMFKTRKKKRYILENKTSDIWIEKNNLSGLLYKKD